MDLKLLMRLRRWLLAAVLACVAQLTYADDFVPTEFAAAWGPSIGSPIPMLSALDQDGQQQDLASLKGTNGLLFVFNRSVDW